MSDQSALDNLDPDRALAEAKEEVKAFELWMFDHLHQEHLIPLEKAILQTYILWKNKGTEWILRLDVKYGRRSG